MERYYRPIAVVVTAGGLAALLAYGVNNIPHAVASEQPMKTLLSAPNDMFPPRGFNTANIVKFNDHDYYIGVDPGVSLEPVSTRHVRKVAGGVATTVTIAKTTSGVYSSDGLVSPHFRYPGIHVERLPEEAEADTLAYLAKRLGLVARPAVDAGSFLQLKPEGRSATIATATPVSCVYGGSIAVC